MAFVMLHLNGRQKTHISESISWIHPNFSELFELLPKNKYENLKALSTTSQNHKQPTKIWKFIYLFA